MKVKRGWMQVIKSEFESVDVPTKVKGHLNYFCIKMNIELNNIE